MIQANEVRRGNLVEYEGRVFEIDIIAEEFPTLKTEEFGIGVVSWKDLGGVMLTEEWYRLLGFEKVNHIDGYFFYTHRKLKITIHPDGMVELRGTAGWAKVHFVHQLQNLVYSLTGEELTLTPNETHNN